MSLLWNACWNINKVTNMNDIFKGCSLLKKQPKILNENNKYKIIFFYKKKK